MTERAKNTILSPTDILKMTSSAPRLCTTLLDPDPPNVAESPDDRVCTVMQMHRRIATVAWKFSIMVDIV